MKVTFYLFLTLIAWSQTAKADCLIDINQNSYTTSRDFLYNPDFTLPLEKIGIHIANSPQEKIDANYGVRISESYSTVSMGTDNFGDDIYGKILIIELISKGTIKTRNEIPIKGEYASAKFIADELASLLKKAGCNL